MGRWQTCSEHAGFALTPPHRRRLLPREAVCRGVVHRVPPQQRRRIVVDRVGFTPHDYS